MGYGGGEDEEEDSGMRRKVWDGMKVLVFVCVVLPRLTGVERGEEAECVGLRWTLVWTSWTGMCRPKERERAQRKGEGRATHAVPTNGPRRRCQGVSGRATPLTSSSGRMPSSSSMPYASAARGRRWGRALSPAERRGACFRPFVISNIIVKRFCQAFTAHVAGRLRPESPVSFLDFLLAWTAAA